MTRHWMVAMACVVSAGCRIGPKYMKPVTTPPPAFKTMAANDQWKMATPLDDQSKGKWWEIFGDPQLNELEALVDINNQNLKQAEAQFRQARAVVKGDRANYYPTIGVAPSVTKTSAGTTTGRGTVAQFITYQLPVEASWEPDVWGRVRLSVDGAVGSAQASAADLENVRLSEQALLATDYFSLAAEDMQQALLADTIAAYTQNLQLTTDRFNAGIASRSDVTLAQAQLSGAQAQSTEIRATRATFEHAIAVLTGRAPSDVRIGDSRNAGPTSRRANVWSPWRTPTSAWQKSRITRRSNCRQTRRSSHRRSAVCSRGRAAAGQEAHSSPRPLQTLDAAERRCRAPGPPTTRPWPGISRPY